MDVMTSPAETKRRRGFANRRCRRCFRLARELGPGHATKALRGRGAVRRFVGCVLAPGLECVSELSEL